MFKYLRKAVNVIASYTLEEKVVSIVALLLLVFALIRLMFWGFLPGIVMADAAVYSEALISDKPILMNPLYVDYSQANRDVSALIFSGLVKFDPVKNAFIGDLADLVISADQKEYLFTLKEGIKWHDGQPLKVEDILFTFQLIQDPQFQNPVIKANFEGVKVERVGDSQIKFTLAAPNSFFISSLNVGILPQHRLSELTVAQLPTADFNLHPVGSGPFQVDGKIEVSTQDGKQKLKLVRFEDYYGQKPSLQAIKFVAYPDESTLIAEQNSIDVVAKWNHGVEEFDQTRFVAESYTLPQYTAIFFNNQNALFKEKKMRVAFLKAINRAELLKQIPLKAPLDSPLFELKNTDLAYQYDLTAAAGALFDAGYTFEKNADGSIKPGQQYRKNKKGEELAVTLLARAYDEGTVLAQETSIVVEFLVKSLGDVGVKLEVLLMPEADFLNALASKEYALILTGQSMGYNLDLYPYWHSTQAKVNGLNFAMLKNFAIDQQIEKLRNTFDENEKVERLKKLAKSFSEEVPAVFLYTPKYNFITDQRLKGVNLQNLAHPADRFAKVESFCLNCK